MVTLLEVNVVDWLDDTCWSACSTVVIPMSLRLSAEITVMASAVSALVRGIMLPVIVTRCMVSGASAAAALWARAGRLNSAPASKGTEARVARRAPATLRDRANAAASAKAS